MSLQKTKFQKFQGQVADYFFQSWVGPWRKTSLSLISLLIGYFLGSTITSLFLDKFGQRPFLVVIFVLIIEILVRMRSTISTGPWPIYWVAIDNFRIGAVYSLVLEAFKLGS